MDWFLQNIDQIEQREKDIVCGFIRSIQTNISPISQNQFPVAPPLVIYTMLYYSYNPERFDAHGTEMQVNSTRNTVQFTGKLNVNVNNTVYGRRRISMGDALCLFEWKFQFTQYSCSSSVMIGIHSFDPVSSAKILTDNFVWRWTPNKQEKSVSYAWCASGYKFSSLELLGSPYGHEWKKGDVISMQLNTKQRSLRFCRNEQSNGVAFDNMTLFEHTFMAVAIQDPLAPIQLLSFQCTEL